MAQERSDVNHLDNVEPGMSASTAGDEENSRETENIRGQIEETRNQMGGTIDAIQDKLSFSNISEHVSEHVQNAVESGKEAIYDATIGKAKTFKKTQPTTFQVQPWQRQSKRIRSHSY